MRIKAFCFLFLCQKNDERIHLEPASRSAKIDELNNNIKIRCYVNIKI